MAADLSPSFFLLILSSIRVGNKILVTGYHLTSILSYDPNFDRFEVAFDGLLDGMDK